MTPIESIQAMAYRVLRDAYVRAAAHFGHIDLLRATDEQRSAAIEPFTSDLSSGADLLADAIVEAHRLGMQSQVQIYHRTAVKEYDGHDMLDEALGAANEPTEET